MHYNWFKMTNHWIIEDADFSKIKDSVLDGEHIKKFLNDVIYNHPNWSVFLKYLSDIYVLVASHSAQKLLRDDEKSWKDFMNEEQYKMLETNGKLVVAYMLVSEAHEDTHYIEYIDTVVRHNDFGRHIINRYEKQHEGVLCDKECMRYQYVQLIPKEIIPSSAKYWAKVFDLLYYDDDTGKNRIEKEHIDEFIQENKLNSEELNWEYLYELCKNM